MHGVCFVVDEVSFRSEGDGPWVAEARKPAELNRKIITCVSNACRQAFQQLGQRIVEPMYECVVHSGGTTQGKVYSVLNRRRCEILEEALIDGSDLFTITAHMPITESFGLQDELRIVTSGAGSAQLRLTHWKTLDLDPYFQPKTKDEVEDYGTEILEKNYAQVLLEKIRDRKGILKRNLIENAEKQKFSQRGA